MANNFTVTENVQNLTVKSAQSPDFQPRFTGRSSLHDCFTQLVHGTVSSRQPIVDVLTYVWSVRNVVVTVCQTYQLLMKYVPKLFYTVYCHFHPQRHDIIGLITSFGRARFHLPNICPRVTFSRLCCINTVIVVLSLFCYISYCYFIFVIIC